MLKYKDTYEILLNDASSYVILRLEGYLSPKDVVLDIGSAQGHLSNRMLNFAGRVYCYDISQSANKKRESLFSNLESIEKINNIQELKCKEINVVTLISVIQYMKLKEIDYLFSIFQELGVSRVILGDVDLGISKTLSAMSALKNIFFSKGLLSALNLLVFYFYKVIFFKDFPNNFILGDLEKICSDNGFNLRKIDKNIGLCGYRTTFICTQS